MSPHGGVRGFRDPKIWGGACPNLHRIRPQCSLSGSELTLDERVVLYRLGWYLDRKTTGKLGSFAYGTACRRP